MQRGIACHFRWAVVRTSAAIFRSVNSPNKKAEGRVATGEANRPSARKA
jgi:hypothetical protein